MGISDDIKPNRSYRSFHNSDHFSDFDDFVEPEEVHHHRHEISPNNEETIPIYTEKSRLEDEFFSDQKNKHEKPAQHKPHPLKKDEKVKQTKIGKTLLWIMMVLLAAILIWQNIPGLEKTVRQYIFKEPSNDSNSDTTETQKTDIYDGEYTEGSQESTNTNEQSTNSSSSTPNATTENTAIDKSKITIEVLNGNGIKNSAESVKKVLIDGGFNISKVANARNFNYETTIVYYKSGKETEANLVKETLTTKSVSIEKSDTIASNYDLVVVVGAK